MSPKDPGKPQDDRATRAPGAPDTLYPDSLDGPTIAPTPGPPTGDTLSPVDTETGEVPERIGHYRILGELGRGGMGVVYRAEQDNPRRPVAIKVIRSTVSSTRARRRFGFEAEVLAKLDHPGIARILEARQETDWAWFAMELVDGMPVNWWAEDHELGVRAKLELLAKLADAVHHAHLQGVVHRDLKPANVLVTEDGQPKVLDFGIARALDPGEARDKRHTRLGEIVGTPAYMSPEQASLEPGNVDGRSDVYTLGVIAYELLSDQLPNDFSHQTLQEMLRVIREVDAPRLGRIDRALAGDIETIVAKALEKEPERRYQSAAALADDIRRYLADEPINARPATATYQIRKFAKRNPALAVSLVSLVIVLAAGAVVTGVLWVQAVAQRNAAVAAQHALEERNAALILLQAQAQLPVEPTRATAWLKTLPDRADWGAALAVAHEARRRGVAEDLLVGHTHEVKAVDWSPDGTRLATASYDDDARIWEPATRTVTVLRGHTGDVKWVDWSPDGSALVTAGDDATLRLWRDGADPVVLAGHAGGVTVATWSPDGARILSGGLGGQVRLWSASGASSEVVARLGAPVEHVTWSPDGSWWAAGAEDGRMALAPLGGETRALQAHMGSTDFVVFEPGGTRIATSGDDRATRLWDRDSGRFLAEVAHAHEARTVQFVPSSDLVAVSGRDGRVGLWRPGAGVTWIDAHTGVVRDIDVSADGRLLASGGDDGHVVIVEIPTGTAWRLQGHAGAVRDVAFSPDGSRVASSSEDGTVRVWRVSPAERGGFTGHTGVVTSLATDGRALLSAGEDGTARLRDLATGAETVLVGHSDEVETAAFLPGGAMVTAGRDMTVRVWDAAGTEQRLLVAPERVDAFDVSEDGRWLVAGTRDPRVALFDLRSDGRELRKGHGDKVQAVALGDDGRFASGSADGTVILWSVDQAQPLAVHRMDAEISALALEGDTLIVGTGSGQVARFGPGEEVRTPHHGLVWDVALHDGHVASAGADHEVVLGGQVLTGHTAGVTDVAFAPDGSLVSASEDGSVRVWSTRGEPLQVWTGSDRPLRHVVATADRLAAAGDDGSLRVWPLRASTEPEDVRAWLRELTHVVLDPDDVPTAPWTER